MTKATTISVPDSIMRPRALAVTAAAITWLILAGTCHGIIKVDLPVSRVYTTARQVVMGKVSNIQPGEKAFQVAIDASLKGEADWSRIGFIVDGRVDLVERLAKGDPVVLFAGARGDQAIVHAADAWLLAEKVADAARPTWKIIGRRDLAKSFPGRTAALAEVLRTLAKTGRTPLRDAVSHEAYLGLTKFVADLHLRPTFLLTADMNGDGAPDLVLGTAGGAKLFLRTDQGYNDVTERWGLAGAAAHAAVGDANGDGRPDLLLGRTLWLNEGDRLRKASGKFAVPDESEWLAVALADVTGDGRADAVVLLKDGTLLTAENPAESEKRRNVVSRALWRGGPSPEAAVFSSHWGDLGELSVLAIRSTGITRYGAGATPIPPADFERLTGVPFSSYKDFGEQPFKVLLAMADDYDGNGWDDLIVMTQGGGLTLVNRGYGTFLINAFAHRQLHSSAANPLKWTRPFPFTWTVATFAAPGPKAHEKTNRRNLIVVTEEGKVYEIGNAPPWPPLSPIPPSKPVAPLPPKAPEATEAVEVPVADPPDALPKDGAKIIARGRVAGTVVGKGAAWVEIKSQSGKKARYIPKWVAEAGGPEGRIVDAISRLQEGDRVSVVWYADHNVRIQEIRPLR